MKISIIKLAWEIEMNLLEGKLPKDKDGGFYSLIYSKVLA